MWEEAGVPGENPHMDKESILTPHRKDPGGIWTRALMLEGKGADHYTTVQPPSIT